MDGDKDLLFSETVKAGKRIYYFDVKQTKNGDRYVAITESKKITNGTDDNMHVSYEKHKVFLYREDYEKFLTALNKVIGIASEVPPVNRFSPKGSFEASFAKNEKNQSSEDDNKPKSALDDLDLHF